MRESRKVSRFIPDRNNGDDLYGDVMSPFWIGAKDFTGYKGIIMRFVLALILCLAALNADAVIDYPHIGINNIGCDSCHFVYGTEPSLLPPWTAHTPQNIDDTQYNTLCWSCHNDIDAAYVRTHSSLQTDNSYGAWTIECRACHNPHYQKQSRTYGSASYIYSGVSSGLTATTVSKAGAGWTEDEYIGYIAYPNVSQVSYNYKILSNTSDTLTVQGPINLGKAAVGNTFAIVYGKLVYNTIGTPNSGDKTVRFFNRTGTNSYADGDGTYDGVCEVCHTKTTHFRNNGAGADPLHINAGAPAGTNCIICHSHVNGFAHGGAGGTGCEECHGHDPGYGGFTGGKGTYLSHSTHTENDADDLRGPNVGCDECHDISSFPNFKTGTDLNGDGRYSLEETDVCDVCHSPGGTYDGVNDPDIGAKYGNGGELKYNWTNRIYNEDGSLKTVNEKWCAACHDESPSQILGVNAPNVVGDKDAVTNYGIGYGFYKTGHGLPANRKYPESGETTRGAGLSCDYCHDPGMKHIDGTARTYVYTAVSGEDNDYRHGYRLKPVNGEQPLGIPRTGTCADSGVNTTEFRLCFSCHETGPFTEADNYDTNFRQDKTAPDPDVNAHYLHLSIMYECGYGPVFQSDWRSHGNDSRASCITCHNVHGSDRMAMVRDGKLINREPGLQVLYYKPGVSFDCFNYPDIRNVSLPESTGTIWAQNVGGICSTCHGSCGFDSVYYRSTAPQIVQVQGMVGSNALAVQFSEGVYTNTGAAGSLVSSDLALTDLDNGRTISSVTHTAGEASLVLTLDQPLDDTDDIDTDTLAAAAADSVYDENDTPMDIIPVTITSSGAGIQTLYLHPSGLDSATACSPAGGTWEDILDSNDADATYADCYSYYDAPSMELFPATFKVNMDDPTGLEGAAISQLITRAVVNVTGITGGGGPSGPVAYLKICYNTGSANDECSTLYDLDGTEGYVEIWTGNTVDPDGNPLDIDDLSNLKVEVTLNAEECCGDSSAAAHVTEVYAQVDYTVATADSDPPVISHQTPADGTGVVDIFSDLTFTLADSGTGVDWTSVEIQMSGSEGYSKLYTDADFAVVSKTGSPAAYNVTVDPDVNFGAEETISVTVRADDFNGNSLAPPAWSFTTNAGSTPQTLIIHPSGVNYAGGFTATGGDWADVLDSNDGLTTRAAKCGGAGYPTDTTSRFIVDMDDSGLSGENIQSIEIGVAAKYAPSCPTSGTATGSMDICYRTGTNTVCTDIAVSGDFSLYTTTHTSDSDGGSLDVTDLNNIQIEVRRKSSGSIHLIATEVYVDVIYLP